MVGAALPRRLPATVAFVQSRFESHLEVPHALALYLGRVRRQHRHHLAIAEKAGERGAIDTCGLDPIERTGEAAVGRRLFQELGPAAHAPGVNVLREVGEVREIAERAHDDHGLLAGQPVEHALEVATSLDVVVPAEGDGALAHALDDREGGVPFLFAQGIAEQPPEQADVVAHRAVRFVVDEVHGNARDRVSRDDIT